MDWSASRSGRLVTERGGGTYERESMMATKQKHITQRCKLPSGCMDLTGDVYGKLTVLRFAGVRGLNKLWRCKCECGAVGEYYAGNLRGSYSHKCQQCAYRENGLSNRVHGLSKTNIYGVWRNAKSSYGLCAEWANDASAFCIGIGDFPKHGRLRPIDDSKPIGPDNFCFVSGRGSGRGRRIIAHNGKTQSMSKWANELGMTVEGVRRRLLRYSPEIALSVPKCSSQKDFRSRIGATP